MAFNRPTLQEIIDRIVADLVAKITGAKTAALRSVLLIVARAYAGAVHSLYGYLDNESKELFATTATGDADGGKLDTIGTEYGMARNAASPAVGTIAVTGTALTILPAETAFSSSSGNRYITDEQIELDLGGAGTVAITCDTAGVIGNDSPSVILTLESPIVGIDSTATVGTSGLTGGADLEIDSAYRERILSRKRLAPHGGASHDLVNWMREVDGVTRAWVYPEYNGAGTVLCTFVYDGNLPNSILPTAQQLIDMTDYLTEHVGEDGQTYGVPVTMLPGLFVLSPVYLTVDMTIRITPNTAAMRASITTAIEDYFYKYGVPSGIIYQSQLTAAIAAVSGLTAHQVTIPAADVVLGGTELALLGTITWSTY